MLFIFKNTKHQQENKMKKLLILSVSVLSVLLSAATAEYRFLTLGDIHFENASYHGTPGIKHRTKYSQAYADMWKKSMPELFTASAKLLDKDVPFVIQLGDFTQGYLSVKEQRAKMLVDSFNTVKSYYPNHKLLFTKGNHDTKVFGPKMTKDKDGKAIPVVVKDKNGKESIAVTDGWDNPTYAKAFLPVIEKELGQKIAGSNFAFRHGEDLYIFFDGQIKASTSINFLKKTLARNPKNRYVFFISHLPVLACSPGVPGWLAPRSKEVTDMLLKHNTIVLTAHTHVPSLIKAKDGKNPGSISQLVVSSIGYAWNTGKPFGYRDQNLESFLKKLPEKTANSKRSKGSLDYLKALQIECFELYTNATGFVILKVRNDGVDAEIYNSPSGKPAAVKKLK